MSTTKKKLKITIKAEDLKLRNEMHFEVQRRTRANVFRNRKKYSRKRKHRHQREEE